MLGLLVAAAVAAASPPPADPSPYFLDDSTVVFVACEGWTGTAFYIGDGKFVTARHVVRDDKKRIAKCSVGGKPITVLQVGAIHDYAIFKAKYYLPFRSVISCAGFQEGRNYYAQGFAMGRPWVVTQRVIGTTSNTEYSTEETKHPKLVIGKITRGSTTEGQSGGPVSDDDGLVVGIVSAGEEAGETLQIFVPLSDTPLCAANGTPTPAKEIN